MGCNGIYPDNERGDFQLRLRKERRIRKQLRRLKWEGPALRRELDSLQREGLALESALIAIVGNSAKYGSCSSAAATLLNQFHPGFATSLLLEQLLRIEDVDAIRSLAHPLFMRDGPNLIRPLSGALNSPNEARRVEAAYLLAHIPNRRAVPALECALKDRAQIVDVRERAAEGLGYHRRNRSIPLLIHSLADESPNIRFWCVFALGSFTDARFGKIYDRTILDALGSAAGDHEEMPGYWSVGLEAIAMLGSSSSNPRHRADYEEQRSALLSRTEISEAERRWLDWYQPWHRDQTSPRLSVAQ